MAGFFPHVTVARALEEPPALRRFSMSGPAMALSTGVALRAFWAFVFVLGPAGSLPFAAAMFTLRFLLLFGMTALHLGNYTVRHWLWRAPAFAAMEGIAEALASLGLIALGRERVGSDRATWADWPGLASGTLFWRVVAVVAFAAVLAAVVQVVRYRLLRRAHRDHTVDAVHHEASRPPGRQP